jgi:thioesterase domain-containing protein
VAALVGYSLGGNLAIELAARLGPGFANRVPVCLLDSYAPRHIGLSSLSRRIVNVVRDPGAAGQRYWKRLSVALGRSRPDEVEQQVGAPDWLACQSELAASDPDTSALHAVLVRVPIARSNGGVLRHAHSTGFDPARFRSLTVHEVEGLHGQVVREHAPRVAALIAGALGKTAGGGVVVASEPRVPA